MVPNIEQDLKECLKLISANWKKQGDELDKKTKFIYETETLQECLDLIQKKGADRDYALHRWYNHKTSVHCEYIFCEFGAEHEENVYNRDVDIYIDQTPFDVKLTVYPAKLSNRPYDLRTREGKNEMIQWYYANQSQGQRKQLINRLYVVCDGRNQEERLRLKSEFELLRKEISSFMSYVKEKELNQITITDDFGNNYPVYSDLIYVVQAA